ncbi:MAG: H-NS family nucleoid-associated regulatory protein [Duodenibacillus sp.]
MEPTIFERLNSLDSEQDALNQKYASLREEALSTVRGMIGKFNFTAADLGLETAPCCAAEPAPAPKKPRKPVAPKYRNLNGPQTWTGRGAQPVWFREALAAGVSREDMLI